MIHFLGAANANWHVNNRTMSENAEIRRAISPFVHAHLFIDFVLDENLTPAQAKEAAAWNLKFAESLNVDAWIGASYVLFEPDPNRPFVDGFPNGRSIRIGDYGVFGAAEFLKNLQDAVGK